MERGEWFNRIGERNRRRVNQLVECLEDYRENGMYGNCLDTCGLYVVGSSLTSQDYNDIDITLVGLDFRAVWDYDRVFLMDPEALIDEEIIVPEDDERANSNSDTKIRFNGRIYCEKLYGNSAHAAMGHGFPSDLVSSLHDYIYDYFDLENAETSLNEDSQANPFMPYNGRGYSFLVSRFPIGDIHFLIHGENLFTEHWKRFQNENDLPFITLKEWENADTTSIWDRHVLTVLGRYPFPEYIDPHGKERPNIDVNDLTTGEGFD